MPSIRQFEKLQRFYLVATGIMQQVGIRIDPPRTSCASMPSRIGAHFEPS